MFIDDEDENQPWPVKLRRWWKSKKEDMSISFWYAWEPRWYHNSYYWIKDHLFPWNVIKIETLGCRYIDKDQILLHGAFQVLVDFVEGEWFDNPYHGHIFDLEEEEKKYKDETGWDDEFIKQNIAALQRQNDVTAEIWHLYIWWKYLRPNRDKEDPLNDAKSPVIHSKPIAFDKDGDPTLYSWESNKNDPEAEAAWSASCMASHKFDEECDKEDEEMLIRLIKVRRCLWT